MKLNLTAAGSGADLDGGDVIRAAIRGVEAAGYIVTDGRGGDRHAQVTVNIPEILTRK